MGSSKKGKVEDMNVDQEKAAAEELEFVKKQVQNKLKKLRLELVAGARDIATLADWQVVERCLNASQVEKYREAVVPSK